MSSKKIGIKKMPMPKYKVGDSVYSIDYARRHRTHKCKTCEGTGYLLTEKSGIRITCHVCDGDGNRSY